MNRGHYTRCPLCGMVICRGPLRSHVGSSRCLAMAADAGVVFTTLQRLLKEHALAMDAEIQVVGRTKGAQAAAIAHDRRWEERRKQ